MSMKPRKSAPLGVSIRALAQELGVSERRVRQLRDDCIIAALPDGSFDLPEARLAYAAAMGGMAEREKFLDETDQLRATVEADIARLARAAASRKAALAAEIGPEVGRLIGRLRACPALAPAGARRDFERAAVECMCADLVSAFLSAAGLQLVDEAA